MAERRMLTKKIIDSDLFLDMPLSAQALYMHLNLQADDDGFVNNPKRIQRTIGASEDDLKLLIAKRFVLCFETGVIVIKHWRMHNALRADRRKPTQYQEELSMLEIKENGVYSDSGNQMSTTCQPLVNQLTTNGCPRIGKDRIDQDSIDQVSKDIYAQKRTTQKDRKEQEQNFSLFWKTYPKKVSKAAAEKAFSKLKPDDELLETMLAAIEQQKRSAEWQKDGGQFIPYPATWLNGRRWEDDAGGGYSMPDYSATIPGVEIIDASY